MIVSHSLLGQNNYSQRNPSFWLFLFQDTSLLNQTMTKKKIEAEILKQMLPHMETIGFIYEENKRELTNSYYYFNKNQGEFTYRLCLRFMKSHYIKCDAVLTLYNKQISALIKEIDPSCTILQYTQGGLEDFESEDYTIFRFNLNAYLDPRNSDEIEQGYQWVRVYEIDFYVDDKEPVNYEAKANQLLETYFIPVIHKILPRTNQLKELDAILNNFDELRSEKLEPPVVSACFPSAQQYVMGLILANHLDRPDKAELTAKYVALANEYGEDSFGYLNLLYKAAEYFKK